MSQILIALLAVVGQAAPPSSEDDPAASNQEARAVRLDYMKQPMAAYRIFQGADQAKKEPTLTREPVYRWTRPLN